MGFTWVYIIFLIFAQNIDSGYSLEPPHQGGSNEHPTIYVWGKNKESISDYQPKNSIPRAMRASIISRRHVILLITLCYPSSSTLVVLLETVLKLSSLFDSPKACLYVGILPYITCQDISYLIRRYPAFQRFYYKTYRYCVVPFTQKRFSYICCRYTSELPRLCCLTPALHVLWGNINKLSLK